MEYFANISTNADGHGAVIFSPDPKTGYSAAATWTGQVINSINPTVTYPGWSNFASAVGVQYRVVSFGVEARSILPAMSNQGSLGIINLPSTPASVYVNAIDVGATNYNGNTRISMHDPRGLVSVLRNDGNTARLFGYASTSTTTDVASKGYDVPVVYVFGGPASTTAAQVRVVVNYELTFASGTVFNQLATPAAIESTQLQTASNYVNRHVDNIIKGGVAEVEKQTMRYASSFGSFLVRAAGTAIGGYLGGPSGATIGGGVAGMIMDVD